jgi:hypothetical protein
VTTIDDLFDEIRALRADVARLVRGSLPEPQQRVVEALGLLYGPNTPFTSSEVVDALQVRLSTREPLRVALPVALAGKAPSAERVGRLLRRVVDAGGVAGAWRLVSPATEGGARIWMVEHVR